MERPQKYSPGGHRSSLATPVRSRLLRRPQVRLDCGTRATIDGGSTRKVVLNRAIIALITLYRKWLSPLFPPVCRFTPTCSEYVRLSYAKYGFWAASWKSIRRLARCHPFHPGGVDLP